MEGYGHAAIKVRWTLNVRRKNHMPDAIHFYEPMHGHGLPHDPFNAIVGPRPIG
jgi:hypothetical protein